MIKIYICYYRYYYEFEIEKVFLEEKKAIEYCKNDMFKHYMELNVEN